MIDTDNIDIEFNSKLTSSNKNNNNNKGNLVWKYIQGTSTITSRKDSGEESRTEVVDNYTANSRSGRISL
ncbi:hypothetical protein CHS0354_014853 [Potamilus streckersoni]|uniref:Uncharacterized protein n=1 Tax=Potamilus streckersoni TaxID=2493646 RepID=A0AAE0SHN7_9BIVA|nr:hypothetical protein CHS0354_014853 [Potamilus streckersoni]